MTHERCSQEPELTEDAIDSALLRQAIAEAKGEFVTVDELLEEWGL
ncbi:MAG: hypothetical protein KME35_01560 [Aphanocapsa sp. GSE-SYN-MK-11-07L]|jgi:hypothetical protein|nr:hypothetical protein [Aphanocapsa sp. GSE-SYN-MK-11-07L]